jgi:hypothetical protein
MTRYVLASDILNDLSLVAKVPLELMAERLYDIVNAKYKMVAYKTLDEIDEDEEDPFDALDYLIPEQEIIAISNQLILPHFN